MTENRRTVDRYMEGFNESDHEKVLSCLTDDVEWILPGAFHLDGKEAFDKEIENPAFTGKPVIAVTRVVEEGDAVVTEGTVRSTWSDGRPFHAAFCDVFLMEDGKIRKLTSYVLEVKPDPEASPEAG
jgi:ketosteroid isomerase-like protein